MTHPHTHKEEPRSWEERLMDEFCVMFERATQADDTIDWPAKLESFINALLSTREKEVREEMLERFGEMLKASKMSEEEVNKVLAPYGMVASHLTTKTEGR